MLRKNLGSDNPKTLRTGFKMASLYWKQHQYSKAEYNVVYCIQVINEKYGQDDMVIRSTADELMELFGLKIKEAQGGNHDEDFDIFGRGCDLIDQCAASVGMILRNNLLDQSRESEGLNSEEVMTKPFTNDPLKNHLTRRASCIIS